MGSDFFAKGAYGAPGDERAKVKEKEKKESVR